MRRSAGLLLLLAFLVPAPTAQAVIAYVIPLKAMLQQSTHICTVKVENLDPARPGMILIVAEDLKGKLDTRRMAVNLKGDSEAEKLKHVPELLKRLSNGMPIVLFIKLEKSKATVFAFTNGTWFQISGQKDGEEMRWSLLHGEPGLRRTFKGTTAEMSEVVRAVLAGKKQPPAPDEKEKPGFGPEAKPLEKKTQGAARTGKEKAVLERTVWTFQKVGNCDLASSPLVSEDKVYVGLLNTSVFDRSSTLHCLERATGKELWTFNNGGQLKPMFSTPCVANGKLYFGEGFHENAGCKLYCLDAKTGKKQWDFETDSHVESTPQVAQGKVVFGAGDDGLYCLDAVSGKKLWQYPEKPDAKTGLHIDATPCVDGQHVYGCSGVSRTYQRLQVFCLDLKTGKKIWTQEAIDLPCWGSPTVCNGVLCVGLGNGRITLSDSSPRGALLCLDAATGKKLWRFDAMKDAVHGKPAVDAGRVYVGSRDGFCYCLNRKTGRLLWKKDLKSPIVGGPALAGTPEATTVYVAATHGEVYCLNAVTGEECWVFKELSNQAATLLTTLTVRVHKLAEGERREIYLGAGVQNQTCVVVYRLQERWQ